MQRLPLLFCLTCLAVIPSCAPKDQHNTDTSSVNSTGHEGSVSAYLTDSISSASTPTSTSSGPADTSTSTAPADTSSSDSSSPSTSETAGCVDCASCNVLMPDCPRGEKCSPYTTDSDTAFFHDAAKCVPIPAFPKQAGEACSFSAPEDLDNCDINLICTPVSSGTIVCVESCTGRFENPNCPYGYRCEFSGTEVHAACVPRCHPLNNVCQPAPTPLCVPEVDNPKAFNCAPDNSGVGGELYGACTGLDTCDLGLLCFESIASAHCDPQDDRCCLQYCDLNAPQCPGGGEVCLPMFEAGDEPIGLANVGVCRTQ